MVSDRNLPALGTPPPLLREHRLYQADWLLRFYGFTAGEILDEEAPNFDPLLDPKCGWAVRHMELFPVEVNRAPYEMLLRVPGIGVKSAQRIRAARRWTKLDFDALKKLGVVLKRARFFLTCQGKSLSPLPTDDPAVISGAIREGSAFHRTQLPGKEGGGLALDQPEQLSLFAPTKEDQVKCLTGPNLIYRYDGSYQAFSAACSSAFRQRSCR